MVGGCEKGCVVGGSGGELVKIPPYVGVEHRIILAANVQCHIRILFILFSILSSLILWVKVRDEHCTLYSVLTHPFQLLLENLCVVKCFRLGPKQFNIRKIKQIFLLQMCTICSYMIRSNSPN